jgi:hypothetical protein
MSTSAAISDGVSWACISWCTDMGKLVGRDQAAGYRRNKTDHGRKSHGFVERPHRTAAALG